MAETFPSRGVWRRPTLRPVDLLVFAALLALLYGLLRLAPALNAPFLPKTAPSTVSTDPANLPYYAVRSLFRMFIALGISSCSPSSTPRRPRGCPGRRRC